MELYLATGNMHKKKEMSDICTGISIRIPKDDGIEFDPEETGLTFIENSLIKAKALWDIVKKPVLADDSGICVDILDGIPGIYSARYEGKDFPRGGRNPLGPISQEEKNALLLDHVKSIQCTHEDNNRKCHYVCSMVLYYGADKFICVQETMEGVLVDSMDDSCGKGGFGYDPIVFLPEYNKTVAELSEQEKNAISHRGKAARRILTLLKEVMV